MSSEMPANDAGLAALVVAEKQLRSGAIHRKYQSRHSSIINALSMWDDDGAPGLHASPFFATFFALFGVTRDCHIERANHRTVIHERIGDCVAVGERSAQDQRPVTPLTLGRIQFGELRDHSVVIRSGDSDHLVPGAVDQL